MERLIAKFIRSFRISKDSRSKTYRATSDAISTTKAGQESSLHPTARERNCNSRLENLPPEVRRHLLSSLDLPRLKALVCSSPIFHQQYLFDRGYILCNSIEKTLGSVTVDAYTFHMSAFQVRNAKQDNTRFLESYSENTSRRYLRLFGKVTYNDAQTMAGSYFYFVKPITEYYARWMLDNLAKITGKKPHDHQKEITLTNTERMRLTRATYRFQLLCQLAKPDDQVNWPSNPSETQDTILAFFDTLQPWEIEELFSFYQFAQDIYDNIFNDIYWDLHPNNPRFDNQGRPPTPNGAFDLGHSAHRSYYLEGITLQGLSILRIVLFNIKDHNHQVLIMQQHLTSSYIPINDLEGVLGESQQVRRRETRPSERDRMQEQQAPLPFRGDYEPDAPPLAWTVIWDNTYSNLYGYYIPDKLRRWGYVFWDAVTLESACVWPVLKQQWEDAWDDSDPRDNLF